MLFGKKILLFGGSGSLGNAFIERYITTNDIVNYSRDESKHWAMKIKYNTDKLHLVIGDIRNKERVEEIIIRENPNIIIIMAALKHIDICEFSVSETFQTNFIGTTNILNAIEHNENRLVNLQSVIFISTDKACEPTNVYGMCKGLSESAMIEKSLHLKKINFVVVRYGNVLNSRGSIIPLLEQIGKDNNKHEFKLTHPDMTRFIMTLDASLDLIEHAICYGESGDIIIPELLSMNIRDLIELFSEKYNKPIIITGLRTGEKLSESLISETQSFRVIKSTNNYFYIKPSYKNIVYEEKSHNYNSSYNILTKDKLKKLLLLEGYDI
jgi:UDP-glucose 4-epimerase